MRTPHFFAAESRLGLPHIPYGGTALNIGVEKGWSAVLSEEFLAEFQPKPKIDVFPFAQPETIADAEYPAVMAMQSRAFADAIGERLQPDETQVVVGGDHSVAYGSVLSVLQRFPAEEVAYVHFDSHSDMSCFADSPSGNFHGMFLRALLDPSFDRQPLRLFMGQQLLSTQTAVIGDLEADDFDYIRERRILYLGRPDLVPAQTQPKSIATLQEMLHGVAHLHISFDIDVFSMETVTATGTPNHWGGLEIDEVMPVLHALSQHPSLSIDLVEVNPSKPGRDETVALAQRVLGTVLSGRML